MAFSFVCSTTALIRTTPKLHPRVPGTVEKGVSVGKRLSSGFTSSKG
jgi:hypothetical protein